MQKHKKEPIFRVQGKKKMSVEVAYEFVSSKEIPCTNQTPKRSYALVPLTAQEDSPRGGPATPPTGGSARMVAEVGHPVAPLGDTTKIFMGWYSENDLNFPALFDAHSENAEHTSLRDGEILQDPMVPHSLTRTHMVPPIDMVTGIELHDYDDESEPQSKVDSCEYNGTQHENGNCSADQSPKNIDPPLDWDDWGDWEDWRNGVENRQKMSCSISNLSHWHHFPIFGMNG